MTANQLIAHLGTNNYRFFTMRSQGLIPPPEEGTGLRKSYSPTQVAEIETLFKRMNITRGDVVLAASGRTPEEAAAKVLKMVAKKMKGIEDFPTLRKDVTYVASVRIDFNS